MNYQKNLLLHKHLYTYKVNLYNFELEEYKLFMENQNQYKISDNIIDRLNGINEELALLYINLKLSDKIININKKDKELQKKYDILTCSKCGNHILTNILFLSCGHPIHSNSDNCVNICNNVSCILCHQIQIQNKPMKKSNKNRHISWNN
jgi:hypothetical protein